LDLIKLAWPFDRKPLWRQQKTAIKLQAFSQVSGERLKKGAHFQGRLFGGEPKRRLLPKSLNSKP